MNKRILMLLGLLILGMVILTGCASPRNMPNPNVGTASGPRLHQQFRGRYVGPVDAQTRLTQVITANYSTITFQNVRLAGLPGLTTRTVSYNSIRRSGCQTIEVTARIDNVLIIATSSRDNQFQIGNTTFRR